MQLFVLLGLALGLAILSGFSLYLTVLLTGVAVRFNLLNFAEHYPSLAVFGHWTVLVVVGVLFLIECIADKVPWLDSLWDAVHTVIRPVGGIILALHVLGDQPTYIEVLVGAAAAVATLTAHGVKSCSRLLLNQSPNATSNVLSSIFEELLVVGGVAVLLFFPALGLSIFAGVLVLLWMLLPRLWRGGMATLRLAWRKLKMPGSLRAETLPPDELPRRMNDELRDLMQFQASLDEKEVTHTIPCLTGKGKGVRGLKTHQEGQLITTRRTDEVYFLPDRGWSARLLKVPILGADVTVESKLLSEDVVIAAEGVHVNLRFPRGEVAQVESVAQLLRGLIAQPRSQSFPLREEETATSASAGPAPEKEGFREVSGSEPSDAINESSRETPAYVAPAATGESSAEQASLQGVPPHAGEVTVNDPAPSVEALSPEVEEVSPTPMPTLRPIGRGEKGALAPVPAIQAPPQPPN